MMTPQDKLAAEVIKMASLFSVVHVFSSEIEKHSHEEAPSVELLTALQEQLTEDIGYWKESCLVILKLIQDIPEAKIALEKEVGVVIDARRKRQSKDVSNPDTGISSPQDTSRRTAGTFGRGKRPRKDTEVLPDDNGIPGESPREHREQPPVGDLIDRDSGDDSLGSRVDKKYLTSRSILRVPLLCALSDTSVMIPLDIVSSFPMEVVHSTEADEGQVAFKDEQGKVFVLEKVD